MEVFIAAFVVVCAMTVIALAMYVMRQESQLLDDEEEQTFEPTQYGPMSVGTLSRRMDVPRKHPFLRTRHSKSLP